MNDPRIDLLKRILTKPICGICHHHIDRICIHKSDIGSIFILMYCLHRDIPQVPDNHLYTQWECNDEWLYDHRNNLIDCFTVINEQLKEVWGTSIFHKGYEGIT